MSKPTRKQNRQRAWENVNQVIGDELPHLSSVMGDEGEFISLYVKVKADGSLLGVLKQYSADGTPMVCFGSGYGVVGALVALDAAIQGGSWRIDKPWDSRGS